MFVVDIQCVLQTLSISILGFSDSVVILMYYYIFFVFLFIFFTQKPPYELRISDWSSDVCSSDLSVLLATRGYTFAHGDRRIRHPHRLRGRTGRAPARLRHHRAAA